MKITGIEPRDDHQVKIVAEFEPETLEKFKGKAARQIAAKAKIPGFRPGKAPYDVIAPFMVIGNRNNPRIDAAGCTPQYLKNKREPAAPVT